MKAPRQAYKRLERRLTGRAVPTTDALTSLRMGQVRRSGTAPELIVRRIAWSVGLRYRVSNRDLPGSPDLANRTRRFALFVHGCFWHRHPGCSAASMPKSNVSFWRRKFARNVERDRMVTSALRAQGYRVAWVWECETKDREALRERLTALKEASEDRTKPMRSK